MKRLGDHDFMGGSRVLMVVEDDPATRRALGGIFSMKGWAVCLAATVSEAMALLDHGLEADMLVLDLMLPDGPGEQILRRVRAAKLRTLVVVCSAAYDPSRMGEIAKLAPDAVLPKPVDLARLLSLCEPGECE
jgi:DNA-binding response OmpR family regulator